MNYYIPLLLTIILISAGCIGEQSVFKSVKKDTLGVGVCTDLAPTSYLENGELKGFEVDLILEISKRLALEPKFTVYTFSELLDAVSKGSVDCGIAYIGKTHERQSKMAFSRPYAYTYTVIVVPENSECIGIKCLENKKVGVLKGSIEEEWLKSFLKSMEFEIISYSNQEDIHNDLVNGKIDSEVTDHLTGDYMVENLNLPLKIVGEQVDIIYIGIALRNNDPELKKSIDSTILDMEYDGTLSKLKEKWGIK